MTKLHSKHRQMASRRAVAPVIATLLLVAIAVVGGSIIFVFSQGFFSSAQISGQPQVESIEIVGYDASDVTTLTLHDGECSNGTSPCASVDFDGLQNDSIGADERIAVYVQNQSAQKVTLTELRVAGTLYNYTASTDIGGATALPPNIDAGTDGGSGWYFIVLRGDEANTAGGILSPGIVGELEAGQEATIVVDLLGGIQQGRDAQFKIETANGNIFVGTIVASQQSG